jgi:trk system potassium uptake protein TrkH
MQESISAPQIGNILSLTGFILKTSAAIELIGAALLSPVFIRDFGLAKGLWYALFHSVSAFCNAGFDLLGVREKFSSLTTYSDNAYFNVVIMLLIIIGGISFMTWSDIRTYKHQIRRYSLQSKIILMTTAFLIFVPAICFFFFEYRQEPIVKRILCSLFQSVTARTAGFNTADLSAMHESGTALMIMLMLTGGAPGSTAGGMKVTTIAVLFLSAVAVFRRKNDVTSFNRRISEEGIRNAGAILFIYVCLFMTTGIAISHIERLPLLTCLFETGSAAGTAGLTLGITTSLSTPSHIMLMLLMFFGRMGGLTMIYAAVPSSAGESARMPLEKINVG